MKLIIAGSRGIPARYGGFESFVEKIAPMLCEKGIDVAVQCDPSSWQADNYKGVRLICSRLSKSKYPLHYYYEGLLLAKEKFDSVLITGVGGALFYLLFLKRRFHIITNTDGLEFKRSKWPWPHRVFLKISEYLAVKLSDHLIADSEAIRDYLIKTYRISPAKVSFIPYGAEIKPVSTFLPTGDALPLSDGYFSVICRLEPENNVEMIIRGFDKSRSVRKLLIIGNFSENKYGKELYRKYSSDRILFKGPVFDRELLSSIRENSFCYLHGHSVGGTNPSLLEAMAAANPVICHMNQFNIEVAGKEAFYFSTAEELAEEINKLELVPGPDMENIKRNMSERVERLYSWDNVLEKYLALISSLPIK